MTKIDRQPPRTTTAGSHREKAATTIQRAWRSTQEKQNVARETRQDLVVFEIDGRRLAGVRSKILGADRSPRLTQAIARRAPVGRSLAQGELGDWGGGRVLRLSGMSNEAASCLIDYLEGDDLFVGPGLAQELRSVARRYDVPGLAADMKFFLEMNRPDVGWQAKARDWIGFAGLVLMDAQDSDKAQKLFTRGYRSRTISVSDDQAQSVGHVRFIEAEGRGTLPPAVFLHGVTSSAVRSETFLEALRKDFRAVLAIDLPGHGDSSVPSDALTAETVARGGFQALDAIVAERGPITLVGNSMGGWVAARYRLAHPENVATTCLFEPAGAPMTLRERERAEVDFAPRNVSSARGFVSRLSLADWQRPLAPFVHAARSSSDPHRQLVGSAKRARAFLKKELAELGDVLLLLGKKDSVFSPGVKAFWRNNVTPGSYVLESSHVGHCPNTDDPAWAANAVAHWARAQAARVEDSDRSAA